MAYPVLSFEQLDELIFQQWERLPSGCRKWNGTESSTGSPVVKHDGVQYSMKALLDWVLYRGSNVPKRRVCGMAGCAHPRHIGRERSSPVAV